MGFAAIEDDVESDIEIAIIDRAIEVWVEFSDAEIEGAWVSVEILVAGVNESVDLGWRSVVKGKVDDVSQGRSHENLGGRKRVTMG